MDVTIYHNVSAPEGGAAYADGDCLVPVFRYQIPGQSYAPASGIGFELAIPAAQYAWFLTQRPQELTDDGPGLREFLDRVDSYAALGLRPARMGDVIQVGHTPVAVNVAAQMDPIYPERLPLTVVYVAAPGTIPLPEERP